MFKYVQLENFRFSVVWVLFKAMDFQMYLSDSPIIFPKLRPSNSGSDLRYQIQDCFE